MKTRMRRFWISVSLAAGSLALPFSGGLRAHDLPTRWTSGANSNPSWNYLLDECLDMPSLPAAYSSADVDRMDRRGTEDWASSCPTESAAGSTIIKRPIDVEAEQLFRNPISRFSKEMTCWVNEWHMIQNSGQRMPKAAQLYAAVPEAGNPPAPDYSVEHFAVYQPEMIADTCAFDAEYQARQTAAELLAREVSRAAEIASYEARITQALAEAERTAQLWPLMKCPRKPSFSRPPLTTLNRPVNRPKRPRLFPRQLGSQSRPTVVASSKRFSRLAVSPIALHRHHRRIRRL